MEFICHESDKGLEANLVTGPGGQYCKGSKKAYPQKRLRYINERDIIYCIYLKSIGINLYCVY